MSPQPADRPYAAGRWQRIVAILRDGPATIEEVTLALPEYGDLTATRHQVNGNLYHLVRSGWIRKTDRLIATGHRRHRVWEAVYPPPARKPRRRPYAPTP